MFGSMKKAMVAGAVVAAVGAAAPAVASAEQWSAGGAPYAGRAQLVGTLTTTVAGKDTTCTVALKADLDNGAAGGVARGQVRSYLTGAAAGGTCSSTVPGCTTVSITPYTSPTWPISTSGSSVSVSGIVYGLTYSGAGCAYGGVPFGAWGSMTGTVAGAGNVVSFANSPGLTMTLGAATVSGSLGAYVEDAAGNWDPTQPITLVP